MKSIIKKVVYFISLIIVLPAILTFFLLRIFDEDGALSAHSQFLSVLPGKIGCYLRSAFYSIALARFDSTVVLSFATLLSHMDTDIEQGVYIGPQSNIGKCKIGKDTLIGSGVHILSGKQQHNFEDLTKPIREQGGVFEKIQIGTNCWIGNNAVVMSNVGENSIIAAGSVVVNEVPAQSIVAGNPAKVIKTRT
ncbi:acyltransferase [Ningiella sp. W23]|uniref:acyltransferase n=1 Tax=Ningiella sp. W23 TaxID=3023715 RepID=UPI003757EDBF